MDEIRHLIKEYILRPYDVSMENYGVIQQMHQEHVIPWAYIQRRLLNKTNFKNDRYGSVNALKRAMELICSDGSVREISPSDMSHRYRKALRAYLIEDVERFIR